MVVLLLGAIVTWPQLKVIAFATAAKSQAAIDRAAIELRVREVGHVTNASQILTNDFFLYFTGIPGYVPDRIGGWENVSLNGREVHQDVSLASVPDFYCSALSKGIDTVLWLPWAVSGVDPALDEALAGNSKDPLLVNAGTIGPYVVTELSTGGIVCPVP